MPGRRGIRSGRVQPPPGSSRQPQLLDARATHFFHRRLVAAERKTLARLWHTAEPPQHQPAKRGFAAAINRGQMLAAQCLLQAAQLDPARDQPFAAIDARQLGTFDVELVLDLAEQLLQQVLERDYAQQCAVLVYYH